MAREITKRETSKKNEINNCRHKCNYHQLGGQPIIDPGFNPKLPIACFTICCQDNNLPCWSPQNNLIKMMK